MLWRGTDTASSCRVLMGGSRRSSSNSLAWLMSLMRQPGQSASTRSAVEMSTPVDGVRRTGADSETAARLTICQDKAMASAPTEAATGTHAH